VGNVSTLSAGSSATVVGTSSNGGANLSLAFGIPAGAAGAAGPTPTITATASTLSAGSSATVTATPSDGGSKVALAFGIPRGADGAAGSGGGASLSDATPSALGTASAGTSSTASRSDHTHGLPSLSTLGAAAANHAHPYVTGLNNLTGALTLVAGSNVTLTASGSTITISATGGGGSANIVEAATAAGFPATGSVGTLYHATDVRRIYFWDSSGVYVEAGTSGGGGSGSGGDGTDAALRALLVPASPTSVTAATGNGRATVSWTAPAALSTLPITDYTVQYSSNSGSTWTTFTRAASAATTVTVTGLTNGTAYTFRVSAANSVGAGSYSAVSNATTPVAVAIEYVAKYGSSSHSFTGTGTITASLTGGAFETLLWLRINASGTLAFTVTASSRSGYDGGALYRTSSNPGGYGGTDGYFNDPPELTVTSGSVTGSQTTTGTVAVTAGQYLVLRYYKPSGGISAGSDSITATLSIS
jgi:hypothetical protein